KQLEKLEFNELPVSTRKYPYVHFETKRDLGNDVLEVKNLSKTIDGKQILKDVSFTLRRSDKAVLVGKDDLAKTVLLDLLAGEIEPDAGSITWGSTTTSSYLPTDNAKYFEGDEDTLVDWLRQYSDDKDESFIRGFLGKMLFSGTDALKKPGVLSGGE